MLVAHYHLPGLFEFYELYKVFLPLFREHRDWFYDWCDIASIYGAPQDCLWGGGRAAFGDADVHDVLALMNEYGISARLTFSNSLLKAEHLSDKKCNALCSLFGTTTAEASGSQHGGTAGLREPQNGTTHPFTPQNGVIVHSDLLAEYLKSKYPDLYLVSSTTKVLTDFEDFRVELNRAEFRFVVPDFRLNKAFEKLAELSAAQKNKVEFLCNECCDFNCKARKECYENVSRKNLGIDVPDHKCASPDSAGGYRFSRAMKNPAFIGIEDIQATYLPMGFSNFKIEGRGLGSAMVLEFLLYYLTKPEHQLEVRESIYLDSMLDLF
ncbi:MAG: hypothetical protein K5751_06600 [Treponemataceae bacterium]|nr:hypothetical protein [Treponemataceae bacterium]